MEVCERLAVSIVNGVTALESVGRYFSVKVKCGKYCKYRVCVHFITHHNEKHVRTYGPTQCP